MNSTTTPSHNQDAPSEGNQGRTSRNRGIDSPSILGRSLGALIEHPLPFLLLSLVIQGPQLVLAGLRDAGLMDMAGKEAPPVAILGLLLPILFLTQLQTGFLVTGVRTYLAGGDPTLVACLRSGIRHLGGTVATGLLVALAAIAGFAFFVIPGWVVLTGLFVAVPAVQTEKLNPIAALRRSVQLTAGNFFAIFALVFVFTIAERLLSFICYWLQTPYLVPAALAIPIYAVQAIAATVAYSDLAGHSFRREGEE